MREKRKYADRREYFIKAVAKRRRKIKLMAIEYRGGKCQICGYNKYGGALDLHHINGQKSFGIDEKGYTRSWERVKEELNKCILVCANCHREIEGGIITQLPWVTKDEKRGEIGEILSKRTIPSQAEHSNKIECFGRRRDYPGREYL